MQIASTPVTLEPGEERFVCWKATVPAGVPLSIVSIAMQMPSTDIHHFSVGLADLDEPPVVDGADCGSSGGGMGGIVTGGPGTGPVEFPDGTALVLDPGVTLVYQLHVMNVGATRREVPPSYVNLVGAEDAKELKRVGLLAVSQSNFEIPANTMGFKVTAECAVPGAVENAFLFWPHMHTLGRRYVANLIPAGAEPSSILDIEWDFNDQRFYPIDLTAVPNDGLTITCTYDNPTASDVHFGMGTKDEMCAGFMYYYPAPKFMTMCDDESED